ncbi:MAG: hypothetical protein RI911_961, partial [Candidatus Parcubacteria bacterium]
PPLIPPEHEELIPPVPIQKASTDEAFAYIERNLLFDACSNFAAIDYDRAWIGSCANAQKLKPECLKYFNTLTQKDVASVPEQVQIMTKSCACPLPSLESQRIAEMHRKQMIKCARFQTAKPKSK